MSLRTDLDKLQLPIGVDEKVLGYSGSTSPSLVGTFTGATSGVNGTFGTVPKPLAGQQTYFLRGDATWVAVTAGTGDMILASTQTNTGAKTFLDSTFYLRNVANTFSAKFTNTNTQARIYTLPDTDGTVLLSPGFTTNQVLYATATNTVGTEAGFEYNPTTNLLTAPAINVGTSIYFGPNTNTQSTIRLTNWSSPVSTRKNEKRFTFDQSATSLSQTIISGSEIPNSTAVYVEFLVVGVLSTGAEAFTTKSQAAFRKNSSGTLSQIGATTQLFSFEDIAVGGATSDITISSGNIFGGFTTSIGAFRTIGILEYTMVSI